MSSNPSNSMNKNVEKNLLAKFMKINTKINIINISLAILTLETNIFSNQSFILAMQVNEKNVNWFLCVMKNMNKDSELTKLSVEALIFGNAL